MKQRQDIKGLKKVLTRAFPSGECEAAAKALAEIGYRPEADEAGAVIAILQRDFARAVSIGIPAIIPLISLLKDHGIYEQSFRVTHHIGESGELGGSDHEMVDTIRKDAIDALVAIGPEAIPVLAQILASEGEKLGHAFEPLLSILVQSDDARAMDGFLGALRVPPRSYIFWDKLHTAVKKHKDVRFIRPLRRILSEHSLREREQEIRRVLEELGEKVR